MKNCLGIEIGHYRIKIAYAEKGELKEFISERVQGMDLTDMHVCADLIKDLRNMRSGAGMWYLSFVRRMCMCGGLRCR